jgi:plasmid stabilization system protein ParE
VNRYRVDFSDDARDDIDRLYEFMAEIDTSVAERALDTLRSGWNVLKMHPHTCRKASNGEFGPSVRELLVNFGSSGYVALFEITDVDTVTVLAVRHQRESDYH